MQGSEAVGHGGVTAATIFTMLPEMVDDVKAWCDRHDERQVPVVAAGGVVDARQVRCMLVLAGAG
jgi:NAD(P)H-dependent flavin oxidoreductase YrpB (nitropropane dioxygenase family)